MRDRRRRRAVAADLFYQPGTSDVTGRRRVVRRDGARAGGGHGHRPAARGSAVMIVDVILPTFNREALLARTLESLLAAEVPQGLEVRVLVVDNASTDGTTNVVRGFGPRFHGRLRYLHEPQSGKPYALNAGIAATSGDLVALIDDDEEVAGDWLVSIERHFSERAATGLHRRQMSASLGGAAAGLAGGRLSRRHRLGRSRPGFDGHGFQLSGNTDGRQRRDSPRRAHARRPVPRRRSRAPGPGSSGARTRTCTTACSRAARAAATSPTS